MKLRFALAGLAALGAVALAAPGASAMPNGISGAGQITTQSSNLERVVWICNAWGRCWHRPNWYGTYGYIGPRPWWRWHRWHRWHRW